MYSWASATCLMVAGERFDRAMARSKFDALKDVDVSAVFAPALDQIDLTSPPSIRSVDPVIHRAPGDTRNAISSAISSGFP